MRISVGHPLGSRVEVVDLDTGEIIPFVEWADDGSGEYQVVHPGLPDPDIPGEAAREVRKGNIEIRLRADIRYASMRAHWLERETRPNAGVNAAQAVFGDLADQAELIDSLVLFPLFSGDRAAHPWAVMLRQFVPPECRRFPVFRAEASILLTSSSEQIRSVLEQVRKPLLEWWELGKRVAESLALAPGWLPAPQHDESLTLYVQPELGVIPLVADVEKQRETWPFGVSKVAEAFHRVFSEYRWKTPMLLSRWVDLEQVQEGQLVSDHDLFGALKDAQRRESLQDQAEVLRNRFLIFRRHPRPPQVDAATNPVPHA